MQTALRRLVAGRKLAMSKLCVQPDSRLLDREISSLPEAIFRDKELEWRRLSAALGWPEASTHTGETHRNRRARQTPVPVARAAKKRSDGYSRLPVALLTFALVILPQTVASFANGAELYACRKAANGKAVSCSCRASPHWAVPAALSATTPPVKDDTEIAKVGYKPFRSNAMDR
jgi:hypothetical protein